MLDSLTIALQGIGYGPAQTSAQGFMILGEVTPPVEHPAYGIGGRLYLRPDLVAALRKRRAYEDELLLLLAASCDGNSFLH